MPKRSCLDTAYGMLGRRGYAVKEISIKLAEKGYESSDISEVVSRLLELRLLDDASFAAGRVRTRLTLSRWGKKRIVRELTDKGVSAADIEAAFTQFEAEQGAPDYISEATDLLLKKFGVMPSFDDEGDFETRQETRKVYEKEKARRLRFLISRGYDYGQAQAALENTGNIVC